MTLQLSFEQIQSYPDENAARRAVECLFPAGYFYEVLPRRCDRTEGPWTVKAYAKDGNFMGYAFQNF